MSDKDKQLNDTLQKVANYISEAQPQIDRHNAMIDRFEKRANEVADVLVSQGVIPADKSDMFLQKVADDPVKALDMVAKLAHLVGPDEMGGEADDVKTAAARVTDPFDRLVLYGDASATAERFDGLVE